MKKLLLATVAALAPVAASAQPACGLPGLPKCGAPSVSGLTFMPSQQTFGLYTASPSGSCSVNGSVYGSATALYQCRGGTWTAVGGGGSSGLTIGTTPITGGTSGYVLENVSGTLQNIATETADALPAATTPSGTDTVLAHQSGTSTVAMTLSNLASFVTSGGVVAGLTDGTNTATGVVMLTGGKIAGATFANNGRNGTTIGRLPLTSFSTWLNQSASIAVDNAPGPLSLQFQAQSGDTIRALVVTVPGTAPWTVTAQVNIGGQGGNNQQAGLVLTDTGGKAIVFYLAAQSSVGASLIVAEYNSLTSFNSVQYNATYLPTTQEYLRINDDGTNLNFYYSLNGNSWVKVYTQSVGSWLSSLEYVGVSANNNSGGSTPLLMDVWGFVVENGAGTNTSWP